MKASMPPFPIFLWRITAVHMASYFIMGIIALFFLNYKENFSQGVLSCFMRPVDDPIVALGPFLQIIRGIIIASVLWLVKDQIFDRSNGWWRLSVLLIGLSILSPYAAAPGSVEGLIYTQIPVALQLMGYTEIVSQVILFSVMLFYWYKYPRPIWNIISVILVILISTLSVMGYMHASGTI
jgi:hypothetical protein